MFQNHAFMNRRRTELTVIAVLIVGVIGYAGAGLALSATRVANAEHTLNVVVSHQNTLTTTFNAINTQLSQLTSGSAFNPQQSIILVDKSVSNSELATKTIEEDDSSLAAVASQLGSTRWLTLVGQNSLDREAGRVQHGRNALGAARTIASDELQDGHFWHSLYAAIYDLTRLEAQVYANDLNAAQTTLGTFKVDVDSAFSLSSAPGLPVELHAMMADMQTFVADYGKQLSAQVAGDDASVAAYQPTVDADRTKLGTYDYDKIGAAITAFYKPLIDRFNTEIAAATG
jgi:hypothetical protein